LAGVTPEGFVRKTETELFDEMIASARAKISPSLDGDADSVAGNVIQIAASKHAENWEVLEDVYNSRGASSSGASLDRECSITGTKRDAPTYSEVSATVNVDPGTYAIGAIAATVQDNPNARFVSITAVTNGGGSPASFPVTMRADTAGPVKALAGTLTNLDAPPAGVNSITNAADANVGRGVEGDAALRIRRKRELSDPGQTTIGALRASLSRHGREENDTRTPLDLFDVKTNRSSVTDGAGRPSKSVEVVTLGGVANEIAQTVWDNLPLGIEAYSASANSGTAVDDEGNNQTVAYTVATAHRLYARVTVVIDGTYAGDDAVKAAVADFTDGTLTVSLSDGSEVGGAIEIADDVVPSQISAAVQGVRGVKSVTSVELSSDNVSWSTAIVTLGPREYLGVGGALGIQTGDVTVVV
jgi:hypothetical protein